MEATCDAYIASGSNVRGIEARLQVGGGGVTTPQYRNGFYSDALALPAIATEFQPPISPYGGWSMPSGATTVRHQIYVMLESGNSTVRVRNPIMRITG
jgi:hypothetical protein